MQLDILIPYEVLAHHIEAEYAGQLFAGEVNDWTGGRSHVEVRRSGAVSIRAEERGMRCDMPVAVSLRIRQDDPGLINFLKDIGGMRHLRFHLKVALHLEAAWTEGWQLDLQVRAGFEWLKKPQVGSLLRVRISSLIEPTIYRRLEQVAEDLRRAILQELNFPERLHEAWRSWQHALQIESQWPVWLQLQPEGPQLHRGHLLWEAEQLRMSVQMPVRAALYPGTEPEARYRDLPAATDDDPATRQTSHLGWEASIPLAWMSQRLSHYRLGAMRLQSLQLAPAPPQSLEAEARFRLGGALLGLNRRIRGSLHFSPAPAPTYVAVTLTNLNLPLPFSLAQKKWQARIEGVVREWLQWMARDYEDQLARDLAHLPLTGGWALLAQDIVVQVTHFHVEQQRIRVGGEVQGKAAIRLENL